MAPAVSRVAKTATVAVAILWEEKFFESWRNRLQIVESLASRGNHFSDPELGMALLRARYLTRRGRPGAYEYIQKHPHDPTEVPPPERRR